ncbi:hypothetical protein LOH54_08100 [Sulfurimonas sp. HSL-3221]|uniref:hypothetical protein n=1 Tax=Sulfurimonadaceae TaxID=2771471 RepID=UPI001E53E646|nr:hypothetical protein [Sulfurimonas sp. HSL-3221]UFS61624.1 hypothetical protein LOH54_08100 [Sulfurimonas sp. HSL-3221]
MKTFNNPFKTLLLFGAVLAAWLPLNAALLSDLQTADANVVTFKSQLEAINLGSDSVCAPLLQANNAARDLVNEISRIDASLAAPLQVDADVLTALDQYTVTVLGLANEALHLSTDLQMLSSSMNAATLNDGITAMLQLSDDIGTMADRIGEMADKILIMSDNIGLMADRILETQQLQNDNVALTQSTLLQTQKNMLAMVSVMQSNSFNNQLEGLKSSGDFLAQRMDAVSLTPWTMSMELEAVSWDVRQYLGEVESVYSDITANSVHNSFYVSADTLVDLGSLAVMLRSLSTAVDGYVVAISGMESMTSDPTLYASLKSMLQLSADIGVMANRILEEADLILAMADNIGLQADQIVSTQQSMNMNIAVVQASILAAQQMTIALFAQRGL